MVRSEPCTRRVALWIGGPGLSATKPRTGLAYCFLGYLLQLLLGDVAVVIILVANDFPLQRSLTQGSDEVDEVLELLTTHYLCDLDAIAGRSVSRLRGRLALHRPSLAALD